MRFYPLKLLLLNKIKLIIKCKVMKIKKKISNIETG